MNAHQPVWSPDLQCGLRMAMWIPVERLVVLDLAGCCDMSGAIRYASSRWPDVRRIETTWDGEPDTCYEIVAGVWTAIPAQSLAVDHYWRWDTDPTPRESQ